MRNDRGKYMNMEISWLICGFLCGWISCYFATKQLVYAGIQALSAINSGILRLIAKQRAYNIAEGLLHTALKQLESSIQTQIEEKYRKAND